MQDVHILSTVHNNKMVEAPSASRGQHQETEPDIIMDYINTELVSRNLT